MFNSQTATLLHFTIRSVGLCYLNRIESLIWYRFQFSLVHYLIKTNPMHLMQQQKIKAIYSFLLIIFKVLILSFSTLF